jgi:hypothetical protein
MLPRRGEPVVVVVGGENPETTTTEEGEEEAEEEASFFFDVATVPSSRRWRIRTRDSTILARDFAIVLSKMASACVLNISYYWLVGYSTWESVSETRLSNIHSTFERGILGGISVCAT